MITYPQRRLPTCFCKPGTLWTFLETWMQEHTLKAFQSDLSHTRSDRHRASCRTSSIYLLVGVPLMSQGMLKLSVFPLYRCFDIGHQELIIAVSKAVPSLLCMSSVSVSSEGILKVLFACSTCLSSPSFGKYLPFHIYDHFLHLLGSAFN